MKFVAQIMEQLDEAGNQIDKKTTTGARLALILIDNVLEILMYRTVREKFSWDEETILNPKYDQETKNKVLKYFGEKTKFIKNIGKISNDEVEIINICHKYRNEAYHINILKDSIIHQIVKIYFQTCCQLFPKLWEGYGYYWSYPIGTEISDILSKFEIKIGINGYGYVLSKEIIEEIMKNFCENRTCNQQELSKTLSEDITKRVSELEENLEYIEPAARNFPYDALTWFQFCEEHSGFKSWDEIDTMMKSYKPKIDKSKIASWKKQAQKISIESSIAKAISKYNSIDIELVQIEPIIDKAVSDLDHVVDMQTEEELLRGDYV